VSLDDPHVFHDFFSTLYRSVDRDAKAIQEDREHLRFRETARKARLIENGWAESLAVSYGESPAIIAELSARGPSRTLLRKLQRFTVSVPRKLVEEWRARLLVSDVAGIPVLASLSAAYDARFGLVYERVGQFDARSYVVSDSDEE
jgi:CRISPR-associated endonuclease/helicase Cas3